MNTQTRTSYPPLPPLRSLLKSRDVEDPVNNYVHRPLAYGFVKATYHTRLTPNLITLMAMVIGVLAGAFMLWGTPAAMVLGGVLLWSSAILDGADGILARAKGMSSQFGRAFDGTADGIVAIATVIGGFTHLYLSSGDTIYLWLSLPTTYLTVLHMQLYDFYKESYLRGTRPHEGGEGDDSYTLERRFGDLSSVGLLKRWAVKYSLIPYTRNGERLVKLTNPRGIRKGLLPYATEETAAIYRKHNYGPMQLWTAISLAPHSYTFAICAMLDRIDVYFWFRLVGANALLLAAVVWQRVATARTLDELETEASPELPQAA